MAYSAETKDAEAICEMIGWDHSVRPIQTMEARGTVYVTGTLLRPDEWRNLRGGLPPVMPDGRPIKLSGYPASAV